MKKLLLCACLMALLHPALAQFYVRANVGYNLPMGSELIGIDQTESTSQGDYTEKIEGVYGTYGTGFSAGVAFGGSFKESQLGYDLALSYLAGKKWTASDVYKGDSYTDVNEASMKSTSFQINPSLTFTLGTNKLQPFARFGPVIGFTKMTQEQIHKNSSSPEPSRIYEFEYTGGISLGFKGCVGVNYAVSEQVKLFTEINFLSMSYGPKSQEITKYMFNGEDRLDTIDEDDRKIDFEKEFTVAEDPEARDETAIRQPFNMNSLGIQVGVLFSF